MELLSINSIILHYAFCILHYYKAAGVLELADKQASDTCVFNMRVQVPSPAPKLQTVYFCMPSVIFADIKTGLEGERQCRQPNVAVCAAEFLYFAPDGIVSL